MPTHRRVSTNGIVMHVAQEGTGPPVVLCHGFPELWYSWRHQLPALAGAGYGALAVDMRGFGETSAPQEVEAYDVLTLCADLTGLLDALGHQRAVFVGHDWGATVVWQLALAHPDRVRAVVGMSVPLLPRGPAPPVELVRRHLGEDHYVAWFQTPGVADAALAADVRRTLATREVWDAAWAAREGEEPPTPRFMTDAELEVFVSAYERTGFAGGLSYYRNLDRNWELTEHLDGARVEQPALFVAGSRDPALRLMPPALMEGRLTDLRDTVLIEGGGHWIQQQRPDEVNAALLGFLASLDPGATRRPRRRPPRPPRRRRRCRPR